MTHTTLYIASDHGGFELKEHIKHVLIGQKRPVQDMGTDSTASVDYPLFATSLCQAVLKNKTALGILACGTGIGMSIAANRHTGIRAALCSEPYSARMSREHNDANILCLGGRVIGPQLAEEIVAAFIDGHFSETRHLARIQMLDNC